MSVRCEWAVSVCVSELCQCGRDVRRQQGCSSFSFNRNAASWGNLENLEPGSISKYFLRILRFLKKILIISSHFRLISSLILVGNLDPPLFAGWAGNWIAALADSGRVCNVVCRRLSAKCTCVSALFNKGNAQTNGSECAVSLLERCVSAL